jgi:cytochrome c oxidase subunit 3
MGPIWTYFPGLLEHMLLEEEPLIQTLAINAIQRDKPELAKKMLAFTFLCACIFLCIKFFEYSHKFHEGLLPGKFYSNTELKAPNAALFFSFYFVMTGSHGIHVLIGMACIAWIYMRVNRGDFDSHHYNAVEFVGLYWHIVDLVWIFLFPLLYLVV